MVPISAVVEVLNEQYVDYIIYYFGMVWVEFSWDITSGRIFIDYTDEYSDFEEETCYVTVSASYEEVEQNAVGKETGFRLPEEIFADSFMELVFAKLENNDYTRRYMC